MPRQVPFSSERSVRALQLLGMRNFLTVFLIDWLLRNRSRARRSGGGAKAVFHLLSRRLLHPAPRGSSPTASWESTDPSSTSRCSTAPATPASRSSTTNPTASTLGSPCIALGRAASKPLRLRLGRGPVHRGEQAPREQGVRDVLLEHQLGSFFASLDPQDLAPVGAVVAFGIPGIF